MPSAFEKHRIPLPDKGESKARRPSPSARSLVLDSAPMAVRSGLMIHQMRQNLKLAVRMMRGDMTQAAFARKIRIKQSALARLESLNNDVFPSTALLIRIALVTGRDLHTQFIKRDESASGPATIIAETSGFSSLTDEPRRNTVTTEPSRGTATVALTDDLAAFVTEALEDVAEQLDDVAEKHEEGT